MSKKANPKLIGGFVLGAVALAVAGVLFFGTTRLFTKLERYVMFFEGRIAGLSVGAPVTLRGVSIGQVTNIDLLYEPEKLDFWVQVDVETHPDTTRVVGGGADSDAGDEIAQLIKKGLRAQLVQQSFVTGQLAINLDFFPNTEAKLVGLDPGVVEIPTIPSTFAALESTIKGIAAKLDQLDFQKILADLKSTVSSVQEIVASPKLREAIADAGEAMTEVRQLVGKLNSRVDPLAQSFEDTSKAAQSALNEAERLLVDARPILATSQNALTRAEKLMTTANGVIEPGSPLHFELVSALREVAGAARSLRGLADSLERNPKSLLFGRQAPGGR
jgi:paraquat-inducible protein B